MAKSFFENIVTGASRQIGREIGRDIYKGVMNYDFTTPDKFREINIIDNNIGLISKIKSFKVSTYDKVTVRSLDTIVSEVILLITPSSCDWKFVIGSLINLIEKQKEFVDVVKYQKHFDKFESDIVEKFNQLKIDNKFFIEDAIPHYTTLKEEVSTIIEKHESRKKWLGFLLSFIGLNSLYTTKSNWKWFNSLFGFAAFVIFIVLTIQTGVPVIIIMLPTLLFSLVRYIMNNDSNKENKEKLEFINDSLSRLNNGLKSGEVVDVDTVRDFETRKTTDTLTDDFIFDEGEEGD